jgi:hypothetical protein
MSTTVADVQRLPAITTSARVMKLPAAIGNASAAGTVVAGSAFVVAITAGKQASGWDPREVWLERVLRPRQRRRP